MGKKKKMENLVVKKYYLQIRKGTAHTSRKATLVYFY